MDQAFKKCVETLIKIKSGDCDNWLKESQL